MELVVTADIGPRIMRFGFVGGQNLFKEFEQSLGKSGEPKWVSRGGHRPWAAPADPVRTYAPDNGPVTVEVAGDTLIATEPVEQMTELEKRITIKMAPVGAVEVIHRLRNADGRAIELAPWALTMMAPGGTGIHGFPPRGTHPRDLNAYTDLSDPRWRFTKKYMMLRQDPHATSRKSWGAGIGIRSALICWDRISSSSATKPWVRRTITRTWGALSRHLRMRPCWSWIRWDR